MSSPAARRCPSCQFSVAPFATRCSNCRAVLTDILEAGTRIAGRYEVRAWLGSGPLGSSYRVHDAQRSGDIALKLVAAELVEDATDAAEIAARVRELSGRSVPGVALPLGCEPSEHGLAITVPLVDGASLRTVLAACVGASRPIRTEEALRVLIALSESLASLHGMTAHGDLHPENVLLTHEGIVLTDAGLASVIPIERMQPRIDTHGVDPYIAPEVSAGRKVSATSDHFAFGAIAAELLAGAPSLYALGPAPLDTDTREALRALLDPDRSRRPPAMRALLEALAATCRVSIRPDDRVPPSLHAPPERPSRMSLGALADAVRPGAPPAPRIGGQRISIESLEALAGSALGTHDDE